jgi:hypothetical protein
MHCTKTMRTMADNRFKGRGAIDKSAPTEFVG